MASTGSPVLSEFTLRIYMPLDMRCNCMSHYMYMLFDM